MSPRWGFRPLWLSAHDVSELVSRGRDEDRTYQVNGIRLEICDGAREWLGRKARTSGDLQGPLGIHEAFGSDSARTPNPNRWSS
jgi:hypothetical protein